MQETNYWLPLSYCTKTGDFDFVETHQLRLLQQLQWILVKQKEKVNRGTKFT